MTVSTAAWTYAARGWPVFPVSGKVPLPRTRGVLDASTDPQILAAWWQNPAHGVAIATGRPSGVWALDVDGDEGAASLGALVDHQGELPPTVTSRTGGGGWHMLFTMPSDRDVRNSTKKIAPGLDVRGTGGYIVAPPSTGYRWLPRRAPSEIATADAPGWLVELVAPLPLPEPIRAPRPMPEGRSSRYLQAALEAEYAEVAQAREGTRNARLFTAAWSLSRLIHAGDVDAATVARLLAHAAAQTGLGAREITRTIKSAYRRRGLA
jgi:hypothetical protein